MSFFMQIFLQFKIYPGATGNVPDPIRLHKYYNLCVELARKFEQLSRFTRNLSDLSGALVRIDGEEIVITPRRFPIALRHGGMMDTHYAIIGTAHVADGFPLYYDAVNEKGLGMAGLNFVGSAQYAEVVPDWENIAQFEFIPRLLGRCATLSRACGPCKSLWSGTLLRYTWETS